MSKKYYVIPIKGVWVVKVDGKQAPISTHHTKEEAVKRGMAEATLNECILEIQRKDGKVEERKNFSNQPAI